MENIYKGVALAFVLSALIIPTVSNAGAPSAQVKIICNEEHVVDYLGYETVNGRLYVWSRPLPGDKYGTSIHQLGERGSDMGIILDEQLEALKEDCGEFDPTKINRHIKRWGEGLKKWYNTQYPTDFVIVMQVAKYDNPDELTKHRAGPWNLYYEKPDSAIAGIWKNLSHAFSIIARAL